MPSNPLTNFEIQKYYKYEPKFNGVYSRNNLSKDRAYTIHLHEYLSIGTHWIALYVNAKNVTYFYSFGIEHTPEEFKKLKGSKNIITNIYRIQAFDSIMCRYFCVWLLILCYKVKVC